MSDVSRYRAVIKAAQRVLLKHGHDSNLTEWTDLRDALAALPQDKRETGLVITGNASHLLEDSELP